MDSLGLSSPPGQKSSLEQSQAEATVPVAGQNPNSVRSGRSILPLHISDKMKWGIRPQGESGRSGIHPLKFFTICFRSSCTLSMIVNVLWPFVPAAFAVWYALGEDNVWSFVIPYIAMVPSANLIGFAGQELARKVPHVLGIILETTFGSIVELILLIILIKQDLVEVAQAAILGSILANLLLCLGLCFFVGGTRRDEQQFHEAVSEVGSNLMLVAGVALVLPAILKATKDDGTGSLDKQLLTISRGTAIILLLAYLIYVFFQTQTHHGLYDELLIIESEKDAGTPEVNKPKLTMTESIVALAIAMTCVTFMAYFLVKEIPFMVENRHVKDAFVGLILLPLVEKAAEHITAVDEAWDNQMNFALAHVLGASIQTALLNTPLVVIIGWGLKVNMNLTFEIYDCAVLILAILVVGSFLRDGKSNYLEGALSVFVYVIIALSVFYFPDPVHVTDHSS